MNRLRRWLELILRRAIVYPLFRLLFRNTQSEATLDITAIRKLLILRYDRLGDMIVTTPVFRTLKRHNPALHIGVVASVANAELLQHNNHVDAIYRLHKNWFALAREVRRARREKYDAVLNFIFNRTTSAGILANVIAPNGFKVGQGAAQYCFYFNRLLTLSRGNRHMVEILGDYLHDVFGIEMKREDLALELVIDDPTKRNVDAYLNDRSLVRRNQADGDRYLVLNVSATDRVRRISSAQAVCMARHISSAGRFSVVIISAPVDRAMAENVCRIVSSPRCYVFPDSGSAALREIASLIEGAVGVVTPDTSIIHFASAVQTPVLGLFTRLQVTEEWLPFNVPHHIVYAPEGQPVSGIGEVVLTTAVDDFVENVLNP